MEAAYQNNKYEDSDNKHKEKAYASTKEAINGNSKELIQMDKSASAWCWSYFELTTI
jgi:hypothetical protein